MSGWSETGWKWMRGRANRHSEGRNNRRGVLKGAFDDMADDEDVCDDESAETVGEIVTPVAS